MIQSWDQIALQAEKIRQDKLLEDARYSISVAAGRLIEELPKDTIEYWVRCSNSNGDLFIVNIRKQL